MAKADVLALVDSLLLKPDDSGAADDFYEEVVRELGFREFLTGTLTQEVDADQPVYGIGLDTVRVLESHYSQTGRLHTAQGQALRAGYGADWRLRRGTSYHVTRTDQSSNQVRLFPAPSEGGTLTYIRTEAPEDVPYWMELPVALEVVSRMLFRESAQQDVEMAQTAKQLASVFWVLVGLDIRPYAQAERLGGQEG